MITATLLRSYQGLRLRPRICIIGQLGQGTNYRASILQTSHTVHQRKMSSDADYMSFLDKANQDTGAAKASTSKSAFASTRSVDTEVPVALQQVDKFYYSSETDEPFEPVSLKWERDSFPDEGNSNTFQIQHILYQRSKCANFIPDQFKELVDHKAEVMIMKTTEFDPRNQYDEVLDAVKKAAGVDEHDATRVYHVVHGKTRAEYYIVALDKSHSKLVGVKVKAVET